MQHFQFVTRHSGLQATLAFFLSSTMPGKPPAQNTHQGLYSLSLPAKTTRWKETVRSASSEHILYSTYLYYLQTYFLCQDSHIFSLHRNTLCVSCFHVWVRSRSTSSVDWLGTRRIGNQSALGCLQSLSPYLGCQIQWAYRRSCPDARDSSKQHLHLWLLAGLSWL